MEVKTSRKGEFLDKEKIIGTNNPNKKKKKISKIFIKYFKNIYQMKPFLKFWKEINKEFADNISSNYNSNYSTNYGTNYNTNDIYGTNNESKVTVDQPFETPEITSKPKIQLTPKFIELLKNIILRKDIKDKYFKRWRGAIIGRKRVHSIKRTKIQRVVLRPSIHKKNPNASKGITNEKETEKETKPNQDEFNNVYNTIANVINKGDKVQRKESKKRLIDMLNGLDEGKYKNIKVIHIKPNITKLLRKAFDQNYVKRKYFLVWEKATLGEEKVRTRRGTRTKSIKRIIIAKRPKKTENKTEEKQDDNKNVVKEKEMDEIYNNFINILNKGDNLERKENKNKLLEMINSIDENPDEDVKEDTKQKDGGDKEEEKEKEKTNPNPEETAPKKIEDNKSPDTEKDNKSKFYIKGVDDKTKDDIIKKLIQKQGIDKNEEDVYNNILNYLKKGDKVQRKESKKKLLEIISDIEDENSFKHKLMTRIKERTYKLLKEVFERNDVKRKYFTLWKNVFGISTRKHRRSIKRIIFKKKNKPETEIKDNKEDKPLDESKKDKDKEKPLDEKEKPEDVKEEKDESKIPNKEINENDNKDDEDEDENKKTEGYEMVELYNDIFSLFKNENKLQKKESKKKLLQFLKTIKEEDNNDNDEEEDKKEDKKEEKKEEEKDEEKDDKDKKSEEMPHNKESSEDSSELEENEDKKKEKEKESKKEKPEPKKPEQPEQPEKGKKKEQNIESDSITSDDNELIDDNMYKFIGDLRDKKKNDNDEQDDKEEELFKNLLDVLKRGDKAQRKESKKQLLEILNIEDEETLKNRLKSKIKERTFKLLKEIFERNDVKRKYFLIWKKILTNRVRRRSIARIKFTTKKKKDQPENEKKPEDNKVEKPEDNKVEKPEDKDKKPEDNKEEKPEDKDNFIIEPKNINVDNNNLNNDIDKDNEELYEDKKEEEYKEVSPIRDNLQIIGLYNNLLTLFNNKDTNFIKESRKNLLDFVKVMDEKEEDKKDESDNKKPDENNDINKNKKIKTYINKLKLLKKISQKNVTGIEKEDDSKKPKEIDDLKNNKKDKDSINKDNKNKDEKKDKEEESEEDEEEEEEEEESEEEEKVKGKTKLRGKKDKKTDEKDKDQKEKENLPEITKIIKILRKGDKVQRKQSIKQLLEIINDIEENEDDDFLSEVEQPKKSEDIKKRIYTILKKLIEKYDPKRLSFIDWKQKATYKIIKTYRKSIRRFSRPKIPKLEKKPDDEKKPEDEKPNEEKKDEEKDKDINKEEEKPKEEKKNEEYIELRNNIL